MAILAHQDIASLNVSVENVLVMHEAKAFKQLFHDAFNVLSLIGDVSLQNTM